MGCIKVYKIIFKWPTSKAGSSLTEQAKGCLDHIPLLWVDKICNCLVNGYIYSSSRLKNTSSLCY